MDQDGQCTDQHRKQQYKCGSTRAGALTLVFWPCLYPRHVDARRVFSHERRKASIRFGSGFQFPAKLVAGLVHA